ncbi:MAG: 1-deoxy-D-xylulose-5-phosphate synthase [candidate division Zixibacteria bacterium SM23_81]|nr:MAG: 1-deoxy-D-xylulose-5-phosphate synthase [candidate division Zixibacteria bacterium SM23_81]
MSTILESIDSPADLRRLSIPELVVLSEEIRERIISVVSEHGGHLAPSLGAVELAIALHYVFDTPRDKVIWDVGHQAYAHKLLTGRRDTFHTLRQCGGISGFCKRSESEYDVFDAGHASTSISSALGIASARDLAGEDFKVVAIIGDGSMTGGLAFEGLNNAGALGRDLIVVLNDNTMSISKNVGAISTYMTDLITNPLYNRLKVDIWELTGKMASVGQRIRTLVARLEESAKTFLVPGMVFEALGFRYFGPIDGHNHTQLIKTLKHIKNFKGPILLHVLTKKGKGYKFAEEDASKFHGIGAFEKLNGTVNAHPKAPSYTEIFGKAMVQLAASNKKVVAITAAMSIGTGLTAFGKRFPDRFFDVGIAEQHAVTFAAGLACQGYRPVAAIYSTFLQRAFDQIVHDVALQGLPVVFAIDRGGLVGEDGPTHHGVLDLSMLRQIPNMIVMAPGNEDELRHMLKTAIHYEEGPVALRYPRGPGVGVPLSSRLHLIKIGTWETLRQGSDAAILAVGSMVRPALEAAQLLSKNSVEVSVINCRYIKPLDTNILRDVASRYSHVLTVEENILNGGFGAAVLEFMETEGLEETRVIRMGLPDRFIEQGSRNVLLSQLELDEQGISSRLLRELGK